MMIGASSSMVAGVKFPAIAAAYMNGLNPDPGWRLRLRDAVVFAARAEIVEATHQRQDGAVVGVERDERAFRLGKLARAPRGRRASRARRRRHRRARRSSPAVLGSGPKAISDVRRLAHDKPAHSMFAMPSPFTKHFCLFLGDGDDDRRLQDPDRAVFVEQQIERLQVFVAGQLDLVGGAAPALSAGVVDEADAQGAIGGVLQPAVDGRVHLVTRVLRARAETLQDLEPHHLRDVWRFDVGQRAVRLRPNYFLRGRFRLRARRCNRARACAAARSRGVRRRRPDW